MWNDKATWLASPRPVLGAATVISAILCVVSWLSGSERRTRFNSLPAVLSFIAYPHGIPSEWHELNEEGREAGTFCSFLTTLGMDSE